MTSQRIKYEKKEKMMTRNKTLLALLLSIILLPGCLIKNYSPSNEAIAASIKTVTKVGVFYGLKEKNPNAEYINKLKGAANIVENALQGTVDGISIDDVAKDLDPEIKPLINEFLRLVATQVNTSGVIPNDKRMFILALVSGIREGIELYENSKNRPIVIANVEYVKAKKLLML